MSWLPNSRLTAVPDEGGPLTTSTVKIIHARRVTSPMAGMITPPGWGS
jgi:hypothetical protein